MDIVMFGDDFGLQNQPIVSPQMFRERIKPLMKKMIGRIKGRTKAKIALHTCGSVFAYLDDFVDIGIDVLNPLQANARDMEAARIKEKAGKSWPCGGASTPTRPCPRGLRSRCGRKLRRRSPSTAGEGDTCSRRITIFWWTSLPEI